jgi:hypothetical protein
MTTNIYILKLQEDKYYIGKSNDVMSDYIEHLEGRKCKWTQIYRPILIIKSILNVSPNEIYSIFNRYISDYGIHKVRGDILQEFVLNPIQIESLKNTISCIRKI